MNIPDDIEEFAHVFRKSEVGPRDHSTRPRDVGIGGPPFIQIHRIIRLRLSTRRNKPEPPLGEHNRAIGQVYDHQCILALNVTPDKLVDRLNPQVL